MVPVPSATHNKYHIGIPYALEQDNITDITIYLRGIFYFYFYLF